MYFLKYIFGRKINLVQRYDKVVLNTSLYRLNIKKISDRIRLGFFTSFNSVFGSNHSGVFIPKFFTYFYLNLLGFFSLIICIFSYGSLTHAVLFPNLKAFSFCFLARSFTCKQWVHRKRMHGWCVCKR